MIVVHRDTKAVEVHVRGAEGYDRRAPEPDGAVVSSVLGTTFRTEAGPAGSAPVLRLRRPGDAGREGTA